MRLEKRKMKHWFLGWLAQVDGNVWAWHRSRWADNPGFKVFGLQIYGNMGNNIGIQFALLILNLDAHSSLIRNASAPKKNPEH
jgi:hypothetical protein